MKFVECHILKYILYWYILIKYIRKGFEYMKDKKIIIYGKHFANIRYETWKKLKDMIIEDDKEFAFTRFIKSRALFDFGINIKGSEDIDEFDRILKDNYYDSKKEWLNEKIREEFYAEQKNHQKSKELVCYTYNNSRTKEIVSSQELSKDFVIDGILKGFAIYRIERDYFSETYTNTKKMIVNTPILSLHCRQYNTKLTDIEQEQIYNALKDTLYLDDEMKISLEKSIKRKKE